MPRAIIAIRNYPVALLLAALMFAASLILAAGSLGYIGGDDEGSGLGGTGKNGDFGGSGLGGTGAPNPFFGASGQVPDPDEREPSQDRGAPAVNDPEALDRAMRRIDNQSQPQMLQLHEPVQTADLVDDTRTREALRQSRRTLRDKVLQRGELALQNRPDVVNIRIEVNDAIDNDALIEGIEPYSLPRAEPQSASMEVADGSEDTAEGAEAQEETSDPRASPERIQRPELPPFQRVRPVQRASIAAPRPRPMRI
ncbi:MAG: hypothetical protein WEB57_05370 [Pseudohongiellaceae bacterium]